MSSSNKGAGVDTRLQNLTNALYLDEYDNVTLRTQVNGLSVNITAGSVSVDKVKVWDGTNYLTFDQPNNDGEPGQPAIPVENYNYVYNGSTWDRMRGTINDGVLTQISNDYLAISKDTNANSDSNRIYVNTTGTVELGSTTLDALETITANQGTATTGDPWKVTLSTGSNTIGNVKIVDKDDNLNDSTHPLYVSGTVSIDTNAEIEIKNDQNNPRNPNEIVRCTGSLLQKRLFNLREHWKL